MNRMIWLKRWGPTLVIMGLIFAASSIPADRMPKVENYDTLVKKGGHMLGYALLGLSLIRVQGRLNWKSCLLTLAGCTLYALSDEFHQSFVPGRNPTLVDVGIDLTGCLVGLGVFSRVPFLQKVVLK